MDDLFLIFRIYDLLQRRDEEKGKTGWLLMDTSSTHGLPADAVPHIWEEDGLRFRGFKMSNTNGVYLPPNTTSHIQPLDGGIIVNFKEKLI